MSLALLVMLGACGPRHSGDLATSSAVSSDDVQPQPTSEEGIEGGVLGSAVHDAYGPSGARKFHHSELKVRKRVFPEYPVVARKMGLGKQRCLAVVVMDEGGVPYDVQVANCPAEFWPETRAALMQWRFRPPKLEGQPVRAQTTIAVTYVSR